MLDVLPGPSDLFGWSVPLPEIKIGGSKAFGLRQSAPFLLLASLLIIYWLK